MKIHSALSVEKITTDCESFFFETSILTEFQRTNSLNFLCERTDCIITSGYRDYLIEIRFYLLKSRRGGGKCALTVIKRV